MNGWRFADRGWFTNDGLNLRADANRRLIADELVFPNLVFGMHKWFYGGGANDSIALTSLDEWDAELARGRPGDNLILLSLRQVKALAIVHAGDIASSDTPGLSPATVTTVETYNASDVPGELIFVRRYSPGPGRLEAACKGIDLRDPGWPWQDALAEHSVNGGEYWLFDGELDSRDHLRRSYGADPPENWTAHHGIFLIDGYLPDDHGRVVCGGAY